MSHADLDLIKAIGKGNGGLVRLVRHKWTGQFFALKVLVPETISCLYFLFFGNDFGFFDIPNLPQIIMS